MPLGEVASEDLLEGRSGNPKAGLGKATNFLLWCSNNMPFYDYSRKAKALVSLLKPTTIPLLFLSLAYLLYFMPKCTNIFYWTYATHSRLTFTIQDLRFAFRTYFNHSGPMFTLQDLHLKFMIYVQHSGPTLNIHDLRLACRTYVAHSAPTLII